MLISAVINLESSSGVVDLHIIIRRIKQIKTHWSLTVQVKNKNDPGLTFQLSSSGSVQIKSAENEMIQMKDLKTKKSQFASFF